MPDAIPNPEPLPWEEDEAVKPKINCYLKDCVKPAYPDSYWCTRTHQLAWQEENYGRSDTRKIPLTIVEMQKRLKDMGRIGKQQPLIED